MGTTAVKKVENLPYDCGNTRAGCPCGLLFDPSRGLYCAWHGPQCNIPCYWAQANATAVKTLAQANPTVVKKVENLPYDCGNTRAGCPCGLLFDPSRGLYC